MRWLVYLLFLAAVGGAQMAFGPVLELPRARGEYLFLLAFFTALHCPRGYAVPAFFAAGLARDILVGDRLGAGVLLYTLAGLLLLFWRNKVDGSHFVVRVAFVLLVAGAVLLLLPLLERTGYGWQTLLHVGRDALFTALISPAVNLLLEFSPLHSWRDTRATL